MNTKFIEISGIVLVILLFVGALFYGSENYFDKKTDEMREISKGTGSVTEFSSGTVVNYENDILAVRIYVKGVPKILYFLVTSDTILNKKIIGVTMEQVKQDGPFKPKVTTVSGSDKDFISGMNLVKIKGKNGLSESGKIIATEINYLSYDLPK